jgi:hypothetical protein
VVLRVGRSGEKRKRILVVVLWPPTERYEESDLEKVGETMVE